MSQKLVMKTTKKRLSLKEMKTFVTVAEQYGVPLSELVDVTIINKELMFTKPLPLKVRVVEGKRVVLRQKTTKQRKVDKQIEEHKTKGKKEGYVPPVGRKTAPKQQKIKCPVCNVRKLVVNVGGVKSIKPHVVKGEPCSGGGRQVVGNKVK